MKKKYSMVCKKHKALLFSGFATLDQFIKEISADMNENSLIVEGNVILKDNKPIGISLEDMNIYYLNGTNYFTDHQMDIITMHSIIGYPAPEC